MSALHSVPALGNLILFTDSRAVVSSLRNITFWSPMVILALHSSLLQVANYLSRIRIIWVPGHIGIDAKERADAIARYLSCPGPPVHWIAPEDIHLALRDVYVLADSDVWLSGKYGVDFPHLTKCTWEHRKLQLPRKGEVLLSRLRTRSLPTRALLFKLHLSDSPLCPVCQVPETCDHLLLHCPSYQQARDILYHRLGITGSSQTLSDLCDLSISGIKQARALVGFLLRSARF